MDINQHTLTVRAADGTTFDYYTTHVQGDMDALITDGWIVTHINGSPTNGMTARHTELVRRMDAFLEGLKA